MQPLNIDFQIHNILVHIVVASKRRQAFLHIIKHSFRQLALNRYRTQLEFVLVDSPGQFIQSLVNIRQPLPITHAASLLLISILRLELPIVLDEMTRVLVMRLSGSVCLHFLDVLHWEIVLDRPSGSSVVVVVGVR